MSSISNSNHTHKQTNEALQDATAVTSALLPLRQMEARPFKALGRSVLSRLACFEGDYGVGSGFLQDGSHVKANAPETDLRSALQVLKMEPEGQQSPRTELSFLLPDPSSAQHLSNSLSPTRSQETSSVKKQIPHGVSDLTAERPQPFAKECANRKSLSEHFNEISIATACGRI